MTATRTFGWISFLLLAACGGSQKADKPKAQQEAPAAAAPAAAPAELRFIHASATAPAVDIYVGGKKEVDGLNNGAFTPIRIEAAAGTPEVDFRAFRTEGTPLLELHPTFEPGERYTLILVGDPNSEVRAQTVDAIVLHDRKDLKIDAGHSMVRFVHAVPGGANTAIVDPRGRVYYNDLPYRSVTDYANGPAESEYTRLMVLGREVFSAQVPFAAGRLYTVAFMPQADSYRYVVASERP